MKHPENKNRTSPPSDTDNRGKLLIKNLDKWIKIGVIL